MVMVRLGSIACASCTASLASASKSSRLCSSGRCTSSRASSSKSSTSKPIRLASLSIRDSSMATSRAAPWRYNSANPRMVVSGVRSSWLASVMNRRIRSSEPRAVSAEDSEDATACWIWVSIPLSAKESRPTSVRGSRSGTRRSNWPDCDRRSGLLDLGQRSQAALHHGEADDSDHNQHRHADAELQPDQRTDRVLDIGQVDRHRGQAVRPAHGHRPPQNVRAVDRGQRHRIEADVVVGWQGRLGVAVVDGREGGAVGADAPHVELRRRTARVRALVGRR